MVQRLLDAGAILVGKNNLDQFATGLNGTRTPHPIPRSVFGQDLISGGSSSGSALAVALGEVPFTVATDTAGSGRVPPALNGVLGFKPSRGLISTVGLVPACRSLDCISLIANSTADLRYVFDIVAAPDDRDPWSRTRGRTTTDPAAIRIGLPDFAELEFFGDQPMASAHAGARQRIAERFATVEVDHCPVPAGRRTALLRPLGRRAAGGVRSVSRRSSRRRAAGDRDDHQRRGAVRRGRRLPGAVPTGRAQGRRRAPVHHHGGAGAAHDRDHLHRSRGAGGSHHDQHPARPLHAFRQPARPVCHRGAGRHHAATAARPA